MRLHALAPLALLALLAPPAAAPREYRIDAGHSDVAFTIGFLGSHVRGRFDDVRGIISYVPGDPAASGVTVVLGVKSIATGSSHRDEHLRSADFFDAPRYPVIAFHSERVIRRGDSLVMTGPLTMHGTTRPVRIPFVETRAPVSDPHGSSLLYFSGRLALARKDFGIVGGSAHNDWFDELRSATMADSVDVTLDITGWDTDVDRVHRYDATIARIEQNGVAPLVARLRGFSRDTAAGALYDLEQLSRVLLARGRSADALALLGALASRPDAEAPAHSALARAQEITGDLASARVSVGRALALDSLDVRSLALRQRLSRGTP